MIVKLAEGETVRLEHRGNGFWDVSQPLAGGHLQTYHGARHVFVVHASAEIDEEWQVRSPALTIIGGRLDIVGTADGLAFDAGGERVEVIGELEFGHR